MRADGLRGIPQKPRWKGKASGVRLDDVRNHLTRDFKAKAANTKWATDITYISPVILHSGRDRRFERHWVAQLNCGHNQHVRHNPPCQNQPWIITAEGRSQAIREVLYCIK
jgi:transposase InsO family protein